MDNLFKPFDKFEILHSKLIKNISKIFISFSVLILTQSLMAATTFKGRVVDKDTYNALPAANIVIEGTSFGVASDLDGYYTMNLPAGMYTVVVTFIGYETIKMDVNIPLSGTVEQNFELRSAAVQGEEVVITAQAYGQVEAINQQISANTIKNVVSSSKIHELPDDNAATALSRLPGLSLQEGDKVVIRGIEARMNLVLVNGIQLPSTDIDDRSTNLGFISSNMLDGIELIKVVTPDMDANAVGGVINLRLREAPVGLHADVLAQGSYNANDRTYPGTDNYKVWASVSNRFLDNKLGLFVQANAQRSDGGNDYASATYGLWGTEYTDLAYGDKPCRLNNYMYQDEVDVVENRGASIILDYKLPSGKILLQNTIALTHNDLINYQEKFNFQNPARTFTASHDLHDKILFVNALQTEYYFGDLKFDLSLSHSYSDKNTDLQWGGGAGFGFNNSTNPDPAISALTSEAARNVLMFEDVYDLELNPNYWEGISIADDTDNREESYLERLYNIKADVSLPVSITKDIQANFKLGGKVKLMKRDNDVYATHARLTVPLAANAGAAEWMESKGISPAVNLSFKDFGVEYDRGQYYQIGGFTFDHVLNVDYMDKYMRLATPLWQPGIHRVNSMWDDFTGEEMFSAGYFMGNFNIGSRFNLVTGVRFEHYNMDYTANFLQVTHGEDGNAATYDTLNTVDRNDDHFFPNIQLRYKATDWFDVRVAYSKTISRPSYNAILPRTRINDDGVSGASGNPNLKPAISDNIDLYFSFYNNEVGLFTIGPFYKRINNFYQSREILYPALASYDAVFPDSIDFVSLGISPTFPKSAKVTTTVNNPNPAYIRGLEFDWQTTFWYLPKPFNAMVLNVNYTRVWSEMDYQKTIVETEKVPYVVNGRTRYKTIYSMRDTTRTARLLYQGDHVVNIALGMDYKGFSGRFSFNMQGDVITSVSTSKPEEDQYTGNIYKWDFSIQQKLPIEGLSLSLSGVNIFNNCTKNYRKFRREITVEDGHVVGMSPIIENLTSIAYHPRRFECGLRYSF